MAYERKILEKINCPRCSYSKAELRLDINNEKIESDRILVYLVCPICRLQVYRFTTNKKAVKIQSRIDKMKKRLSTLDTKTLKARTLRANITVLEKEQRKHETGV